MPRFCLSSTMRLLDCRSALFRELITELPVLGNVISSAESPFRTFVAFNDQSMPTELTDSSKLIGGRIKIQHLLRCLVIAFQHKYCMLVHVAMRISWSSCLHRYWVTVWSDHDSVNVNNASTCIWHSHCYSLIKLKANACWMLMQRCCFCLNI